MPTPRGFEATREWFGEPTARAFFGDRAYFDRHDPLHLYHAHADVARTLVLRLDVGAADPLRPTLEWFHGRLDERGVPHEWRVLEGSGHGADDGFWSHHVPDFLRFYDRAFERACGDGGVEHAAAGAVAGETRVAAGVTGGQRGSGVCPGTVSVRTGIGSSEGGDASGGAPWG
jgi:hypothetical protein